MKIFVIGFTLSIATAFAQDNKNHSEFIDGVYKKCLTEGTTYQLLGELCEKFPNRLSGSPGAEKAIAWTKEVMQKYEFDNVFLQEVMVPHWVRGEKEQASIATGSSKIDLAILALGRSVATPAEGLTAEVIVVKSLEEIENLAPDKVAGKIVFYDEPFAQEFANTFRGYGASVQKRVAGASRAAKLGAVAVVIRSVGTGDDDFPHTGSLRYDEDAPQIPAAALGAHSADKLAKILQKNPKAKLFLKMNCQTLPDVLSYNVIGEIKGSENPEAIIAVGGHLDAWDTGQGAHDDGAGVMQSIAALQTLKSLSYKPKHTLRAVMFINEENGLRGGLKYADLAVENNEKHIIAIESDAGGFTPRAFSFKGADSSVAKMQNWIAYFPNNTIDAIRAGHGGADIGPLNKADGTPVAGFIPDGQRYFDFHHSPADVFSAINKRELELGTASLASFIYLIDQEGL
ncbi:MAG: M20/M25/M40 family metallo-hydrolase [Deferribacteres bacterium]|nr:M20/M25/M40 family metallo-hydrolase [candidate division KSB1 bacterium]MCB9504387.1 M20/M25/M40 family metallo-hydrolase [Deferribacteres bacterium]